MLSRMDMDNTHLNDLSFFIVQNERTGETTSLSLDVLRRVDELRQAIQSAQSYKINSWQLDNERIDLYFRDGNLEAEVISKNKRDVPPHVIPYYFIEGLTQDILARAELLPLFLDDSWVRLAPLQDGGYKLYINSRLRAGWSGWYVIGGIVLVVGGVGLVYAGVAALSMTASAVATKASVLGSFVTATSATVATATTSATAASLTIAGVTIGAKAAVGVGLGAAVTGAVILKGEWDEKNTANAVQAVANKYEEKQKNHAAERKADAGAVGGSNQQVAEKTAHNQQLREQKNASDEKNRELQRGNDELRRSRAQPIPSNSPPAPNPHAFYGAATPAADQKGGDQKAEAKPQNRAQEPAGEERNRSPSPPPSPR